MNSVCAIRSFDGIIQSVSDTVKKSGFTAMIRDFFEMLSNFFCSKNNNHIVGKIQSKEDEIADVMNRYKAALIRRALLNKTI